MLFAADAFARHREMLDEAVEATRTRGYFGATPSRRAPRCTARRGSRRRRGVRGLAGQDFPPRDARQPTGRVATEQSPYGFDLGVRYPGCARRRRRAARRCVLPACGPGATPARGARRRLPGDPRPAARPGLRARQRRAAHRGQAFVMAFQAGGAHALDRALEAIAYAYVEMTRAPRRRCGRSPGRAPMRMEKTFTVVPRGVALVIGCNTFPTWNSWPGLFASLVTGNPVIVKPHPVRCCRWRSPCRSARGARRGRLRPATSSRWPPRTPPTGWPRRWPAARGEADRLHRRQRLRRLAGEERHAGDGLHREGRRQHRRDRLDRRLQGRCASTWRSPSPSTPARCARRRRTSTCRPTASRPTRATSARPTSRPGIGAALGKLLGDDARAVELLGGVVNAGVLDRLEAAASQGEVYVASRDGDPPGVRRRDGAHARPSSG